MTQQPEVWLRGPVEGVVPELQPVAHALLQALEDSEVLLEDLDVAELWTSVGGAATIGFHARHMAGSLDRLLTYARGERLTEAQKVSLASEKDVTPAVTARELLGGLREAVMRALEQIRQTDAIRIGEYRTVGRAGYPSSVRGLLFHAAEHTARHAGQISTTVKIIRGLAAPAR